MKKSKTLGTALVAAALCMAAQGLNSASAQETSANQTSLQPVTSDPAQIQQIDKSKWIGCRVTNPQGKRLGKITDVIEGYDSQHASYCVVKVKSGMFARTRLVGVPLVAFQASGDGSCVILNASRGNLAHAQPYDPNMWPMGMNNVWGAEPTALPPSEVYGAGMPISHAGPSRTQIDDTYTWDQFPCPKNSYQAIDQAYTVMIFGVPVGSH